MGGFFGTISNKDCVNDLFYGTDYNSHLGTKRAGLVTFDPEKGFSRSIHSLEKDYFRSKFEDELDQFHGSMGIGVISDTDPQPMIVNSHLGRFAVVTVAKINNQREIADKLLAKRMHFSELSANKINPTELVALLINMGETFLDGINKVFDNVEGSCSMLVLTEDGLIAARDKYGRTPIVIGRKEGAYAATSESSSFPNLEFHTVHHLGPGEVVKIKFDSMGERGTAILWARKMTRRWTSSAACPTPGWAWPWGMLRGMACHTRGRCSNIHPLGPEASHRKTRQEGGWWQR